MSYEMFPSSYLITHQMFNNKIFQLCLRYETEQMIFSAQNHLSLVMSHSLCISLCGDFPKRPVQSDLIILEIIGHLCFEDIHGQDNPLGT